MRNVVCDNLSLFKMYDKAACPSSPSVSSKIDQSDGSNHGLLVFGLWICAIGTVFNAVGSTNRVTLTEALRSDYTIYGNTLESVGNALVADAIGEKGIEKNSAYIITIGSLTALYADFANVTEEKTVLLAAQGALIEGAGTSYAIFGVEPPAHPTLFEVYSICSTFLQLFGNGLEALGGITELKGGAGEPLYEIGTIAQAIGAILTALFYGGAGTRIY